MLTIDFERLGLKPGAKVLDLGCGEGRHVRETRRYPGVMGVAVDIGEREVADTAASLGAVDDLAPEAGGAVPNAGPWGVIRASGYELPFEDASFDCVIISEVLEHLHDDDAAIREFSRVLRPAGALAVSVPREGPEAVCWALSRQYRNTPGGHVRIYRRTALRRKLARHGYRVVGTHFAHGLHSPYWWLKCLVGVDNDRSVLVRTYHRLLVWDLMKKPRTTRVLEKSLDPFIGKSVVFYATKTRGDESGIDTAAATDA
jgi:SAM-dependent methyltransferase